MKGKKDSLNLKTTVTYSQKSNQANLTRNLKADEVQVAGRHISHFGIFCNPTFVRIRNRTQHHGIEWKQLYLGENVAGFLWLLHF